QIYNYCYSTDKDGYVTALNTNLCDIADELKVMVIPTPAVRPAKPDLLEQYQIELEQLASNSYEYTRQKNIQLDIKLTTANEKIADLENQLAQAKAEQADAPADDLTLQTILDESHDEHAPDLKHAINLWIDLYINKGVGGGSHSAMANNWIYGNTGYESSTESSPVKRLREITTPLKDFGGQRPKEVKK
ncbi:hypothetical protein ACTXM6_04090, partial [Psychrobacter celer]